MRLIGRAGVTWLTLTLLLVQAGCAAISPSPPTPLPPEMRAQLGRVGVVSGRFVPATHVDVPTAGKLRGAAKGVAVGVLGVAIGGAGWMALAFGGCSGSGCELAAVIGLGVLIGAAALEAVTGAVVGAVTAESAAKVRAAEAGLQHAFAELKIQETQRDRLLAVARDETRLDLVPGGDLGPTAPDVDADYHPLAAQGIDTILEVSVTRLGLTGDPGLNPPLALSMTTRIRLIRSGDGAELYREELSRRSGSRKFVEWAANGARAFHESMDAAYTDVSREIVRLVAGSTPAPAPPAPRPLPSPEPTLRAVPVNEWKTAPIGENGATVRYRLVEKGSPLDTCTPPLVSVRIYAGGVTCAPAELLN